MTIDAEMAEIAKVFFQESREGLDVMESGLLGLGNTSDPENIHTIFRAAHSIKGVKVVVKEVENIDRDGLRQLVDSLRQKLGSGVVVLGMPDNGKVALIAGVTKDLTAKVHAGKLIQALAQKVGGKGGGRPDLAEGGGEDTTALNSALQSVPSYLEPLL